MMPDDFSESHDARMLRKFGSMEKFERFKLTHGLSEFMFKISSLY